MNRSIERFLTRAGGLWITALSIALAGVLLQFHLPPKHFWHAGLGIPQLLHLLVGVGLAITSSQCSVERWNRAWPFVYGIATTTLASTLLLDRMHWARRWIFLRGFTLQPSELARLALVFSLASLLARDKTKIDLSLLLRIGVLLGLQVVVLLLQPDLGSAIITVLCALALLSALPWEQQARWAAFGAACSASLFLCTHLHGYQRARFYGWLFGSWHSTQARIVLASGGWFGQGFSDTERVVSWLPEAHTDFAFACWGHATGLLGSAALITLYAMFGILGLRVAHEAPTLQRRLLALGCTAVWCVPAAINIAMVLGLLPIVGVPLPLLSFGGSHLFACMIALGTLTHIANEAPPTKTKESAAAV